MRLRRGIGHGRNAVALAFAVVAGTLGAGPAAVAAPSGPGAGPDPGTPATNPEQPTTASSDLAVWPRPQSLRTTGTAVKVTDRVALVADADADPYALDALRTLLRGAGARTITDLGPSDPVPPGALVVRAQAEQPYGDPRYALPSGGYLLTTGDGALTLTGAGEDGLFHAVQTLRQLLRPDGTIPGVTVRDWPGTAVRGTTEGFYGAAWTQEQRLAHIDFMGRTKQNRYLYAPGDDLYRQERWREPYPAKQRAQFRELAERARRNHVTLGWAVAPGQSLCFASDDDIRALKRKLDAMWALGFRAFQLQFQNVSYSEWHCDADPDRFGSGPKAAAHAQARVANELARHLAERHPGAEPLSLMPTEFYEDGATPYRRALASALDQSVQVAWTGVGVVPRTITGAELAEARAVFGHPLVTMDNYPVNDYAEDRIFLGPYTGREPAVAGGSAALLANAMEQAEASRIPLFTAADYAWNPRNYRPEESWRAAIADLAGGDKRRHEALAALAGNDASSVLGGTESAYLRPLIEALWKARRTTDQAANETAEARLRAAFTVMRETPGRLGTEGTLDEEVAPWTAQLARYGEAGTAVLDMLRAQREGDAAGAWKAYRTLERLRAGIRRADVTVGKGVLDPFLDRARREYAAWAGLTHEPAPERGDPLTRTVRLPRAHALTSVTVLSDPGTTGTVEVHVPGQGWHRVGTLAKHGATELDIAQPSSPDGRATRPPALWPPVYPDPGPWTRPPALVQPTPPPAGTRVDAVRVTGADPSRVHHLVPWFADTAQADLKLSRTETDAEIGGTERLTARLTSRRPSAVRGKVAVEAPEGIEVRVPSAELTVPRGVAVDVPVEVTVPPTAPSRAYDIRVTFAGETRTLTVRTFPRTAGPDLARAGRATSSGDETPDFPASAAIDGKPSTRWSSPVDDGAWWQVELPAPVRLGKVVLHWQEAHPSAYRVQVSPDGRRWRTASAVRDSRGGRETVRMDERDVRFVRVQGDKRATRFGYSLWSVEAYAVAD
ncbi:beta-N-acetylglucosaminidase domain-containing protein [Streptomyces sp. LB8]|uniref:beta-N-acetylglucosaminidase domain-containing protein n=1 Tax=Streptomyces sp. LB8 TaxID=3042509 RepID=UPI0026472CC6|nr:beta-N-acetylglucosaminidase domain-containing protein [Streptomyces sp. LB8]MDN5384473.1 beta-N-acetylglucosaminidase domain-containing protein [Streptomyces sp. LB8]